MTKKELKRFWKMFAEWHERQGKRRVSNATSHMDAIWASKYLAIPRVRARRKSSK